MTSSYKRQTFQMEEQYGKHLFYLVGFCIRNLHSIFSMKLLILLHYFWNGLSIYEHFITGSTIGNEQEYIHKRIWQFAAIMQQPDIYPVAALILLDLRYSAGLQ